MLNPVKVSSSSANVRHVWRARTCFWLAGWFHTIFSTLLVKTRHGKISSARIRVSLTAAASKLSASPPSKSEWSAVSFFSQLPNAMIVVHAHFKKLIAESCAHALARDLRMINCATSILWQYSAVQRQSRLVSQLPRTPQDLKLLKRWFNQCCMHLCSWSTLAVDSLRNLPVYLCLRNLINFTVCNVLNTYNSSTFIKECGYHILDSIYLRAER